MNPSNQSTGSYYFKVVRTTNTKTYLFPSNISVQEFFRVAKLHIMDDFGLDNFELVLAGQQIPGYQYAEDVPAIDITILTGSIYENYGVDEAFYIRILSNPNQLNNDTTTTATMTTDTNDTMTTDSINVFTE